MVTIDQYLLKLRSQVDELKARVALPALRRNNPSQQGAILLSFLNRAIQIGEGSLLLGGARLGNPLFVLMRVLCEDLFLIAWISSSESNAAEYARAVESELAKIAHVNLEKGRAKVVSKRTGEDHTAAVIPKIQSLSTVRMKIEPIASKLGLSKAYDIVYRFSSLEMHGKTFGLPSSSEDNGLEAGFSTIISLLKAFCLIVDNKALHNRTTTANEVLLVLGIDTLGGK